MSISLRSTFHVALHYQVLSYLDLPGDAASIYLPRPERPSWIAPLREAYLHAPGRLIVQGLPLVAADLPQLLTLLLHQRPPPLQDEPGQQLSRALVQALAAEEPRLASGWPVVQKRAAARASAVGAWLIEQLTPLRHALHQRASHPPPLIIHDCPALGRPDCTFGRGVAVRQTRAVAVSCAAPVELVLCQILHEEIHTVTDLLLRPASGSERTATQEGQPGFALHRQCEQLAVELGQSLLEEHGVQHLEAYAKWRQRFRA